MDSRLVGGAAMLLFAWCLVAVAEEQAGSPDPASEEQGEPAAERKWQVFFGTSSIWPRLGESEDKIDRQLNNGLGRLFPRWDEPTTFKDWRNEGRLGDVQIGIGHRVTNRIDWFAVVGGAKGRITNDERYFKLGLPLKLNIDFERTEWFASTGLDFFPWGRPEMPAKEAPGNAVMKRLRASKTFFQGVTTYLSVKEDGEVAIDLPVIGNVARHQDKSKYNVIGLSPRIGLDIPLSESNSLALTSGYNFFTSHGEEFNGLIFCSVIRHRF